MAGPPQRRKHMYKGHLCVWCRRDFPGSRGQHVRARWALWVVWTPRRSGNLRLSALTVHQNHLRSSVKKKKSRCLGFILGDSDSIGLEWGWESISVSCSHYSFWCINYPASNQWESFHVISCILLTWSHYFLIASLLFDTTRYANFLLKTWNQAFPQESWFLLVEGSI